MNNLEALRILYWNCRGALSKEAEFEKLSESFDILFLAETRASSFHDFLVRGFDCLRIGADADNIRGIIALIRNPIIYSPLDLSSMIDNSIEALNMKLSFDNSHLYLIGIYRHPNVPASANFFSSLTTFIHDHDPSILLGDFNAHHPMWGGSRTDAAGRIFGKFIDDHHLVILNPPASPTYISFSPPRSSTIDLTIAFCVSSFCEAQVLSNLHGSDHYPIAVRVNCVVRTSSVFSYKITLTKTQWIEVKGYLRDNFKAILQTINSIHDPISQYNTFQELIAVSYEHLLSPRPLSTSPTARSPFTRKGSPPAPWWTPECSEAIRNRGNALRAFLRNPSQDNYIFYRSVVCQTRKILRRAKRNSWKTFCGSLDFKTPTTEIWRMLKCFRNRRLLPANSNALNKNS
ncbi:PREDICTED: RNA-directed DNA polymerase from mobile element jockey-like [Trachymyrmex cornetzi]|uniref:RNA-directed DNA polymerase from mobile element jockey-like n=1 Tax=Trachymyrmex cornetzi TaxID=471704 RepID=UPI00084F824D|nr:PREDICTED: RNA-directed DNA polymerase from mobile element jockey-like [Trachymyrmex cornetzi]